MAETAKMNNSLKVKYAIEIVATILAIVICTMQPFEGLGREAMIILGSTFWAIVNWVLGLTDLYVSSLIMCIVWYLFGCAPLGTIMSGFVGTTWWLLIGVMGLGAAVNKCGLLKRLSVFSLKLFKPTYKGQLLGIVIMGIIVAPFIPSTTAKCAIVGPLALGIGNELGIPKRSPGRMGLLMALWLGFNISGNFFINASFQGYMLLGNLPAETQATYTWMTWFVRNLPWTIVVTVLFFIFIRFAYKETNVKEISKEYIDDQLKSLGALSRDEKITSVVMVIILLLFIFESRTGITAMAVSVLGMCVLTLLKVIGPQEYIDRTLWPLMTFFGLILGMGEVFTSVGINDWLLNTLSPLVTNLSNPFVFIAAVSVITYIVRLFVAQVPANILLVTLLYPIAMQFGMDPWIACIVVYNAGVIFYPAYVHPNMVVGYAAVGGEEYCNVNMAFKADVAYMIISILGLWACVPFWRMFGML